jgi:methylase of polypeptide subunit release factors
MMSFSGDHDNDKEDATTATHLAAAAAITATGTTSSSTPLNAQTPLQPKTLQTLQSLLQQANYTTAHIGNMLHIDPRHLDETTVACPLFVKPAAPGTLTISQVNALLAETHAKNPELKSLAALVVLFLLGATLSYPQVHEYLGQDLIHVLESLSFLRPSILDPTRCLATVQIFPLTSAAAASAGTTTTAIDLFFVTDWHPRVLQQTHVGDDESSAVMYIGPDSLALVQHFTHYIVSSSSDVPPKKGLPTTRNNGTRILDVCTGSGIQGLSLLFAMHRGSSTNQVLEHDRNSNAPPPHLTCLDVNPRALRFVVVNALLNGMNQENLSNLQLIQADLCNQKGKLVHLQWNDNHTSVQLVVPNNEDDSSTTSLDVLLNSSSSSYDIVLANPPFLPVPPVLQYRHGAFSDGGGTGEEVLQAIVELSSRLLRSDDSNGGGGGTLAVVSEFFLSNDDNSTPSGASLLLHRIQQ